MELALARIEMLYIEKDSVHWEMFKNNCMEKEKEQIMDFFLKGYSIGESDLNPKAEFGKYYNQTYNQEPKKEYQPSEEYLKKQKELMEDFIWNKMNKNNQNK